MATRDRRSVRHGHAGWYELAPHPWGAPDLRGYYLTATYTPLERPKEVTKPLYTVDEAIQAFMYASTTDVRVDPATVHPVQVNLHRFTVRDRS